MFLVLAKAPPSRSLEVVTYRSRNSPTSRKKSFFAKAGSLSPRPWRFARPRAASCWVAAPASSCSQRRSIGLKPCLCSAAGLSGRRLRGTVRSCKLRPMPPQCGLTPPSSGRPKGRFAPFGPPLMSNVRSLVRAKKMHAAPAAHEGAALREAHVTRSVESVRAVGGQSVEGAPRRRAAPGNQLVKVAAGAATGRQTKCSVGAGIEGTVRGRASEAPRLVRVPLPKVSHQPRPCATAQRLRLSSATAGVGASAHARHASATHLHATTRPALVAFERNGHMRGKYTPLFQQAPNPSIERTSQRPLRALWSTAHVER